MDRDVKQNIAENTPIENPPEAARGATLYRISHPRRAHLRCFNS